VHRARLAVLTGIAALIIGVLPASSAVNDWGTWTFTGHWTSWNGTFYDAHRVTGAVMGTTSLVRNNSITSFTIGGHICKISTSAGTGYCYTLNIAPNTKLKWKVTTRKPLTSSKQLVPCIKYNAKYHCRYGNG
jgi:hypothetical protein